MMEILIVTGSEKVRGSASELETALGMAVAITESRREALSALRAREFTVVVVDETLAECDPAGTDAIWERAGLAIPLQVNFALASGTRIVREIRAALFRRRREQELARRAATSAIETEMRSTIAGLLLNSQLALAGPELPAPVVDKLRVVADLATSLRQQLANQTHSHTARAE